MKRNLYKLAMASVGALAISIQSPVMADDLGSHDTTVTGSVAPSVAIEMPGAVALDLNAELTTLSKTQSSSVHILSNVSNLSLQVTARNSEATLPSTITEGGNSLGDYVISVAVTAADNSSHSVTATATGTLAANRVGTAALGQYTYNNTGSVTISITRTSGKQLAVGNYSIPVTVTTIAS